MKRLIITIILLTSVAVTAAPYKTYYVHVRGRMLRVMTGNPAHQKLMDVWVEKKCFREKPLRKNYTTEEWKKLTPEEKKKAVKRKIKWNKVTDPNTGKTTGNDKEYTAITAMPNFNADPNTIEYDFDPNVNMILTRTR